MPDHSDLGDRMKAYESDWDRRLMPLCPAIVRLDGRSFHNFTKGLNRPYHKPLSELMVATTKHLIETWNCCIAYVQSDEITLVFLADYKNQLPFGGRIQKLISILAADTSTFFREACKQNEGDARTPTCCMSAIRLSSV
jgi:tRNA(His) 5'-end guanylyltransferase